MPGLKILGWFVKSTTVDSIPNFDLPPSIIIFNFFLNSSNTLNASIGLKPDEIFALGIASGKLKNFNKVFITLCFGNLIATVFKLAVAKDEIFEFLFFFKTKVIGPGQNLFYNLKKFLLK